MPGAGIEAGPTGAFQSHQQVDVPRSEEEENG